MNARALSNCCSLLFVENLPSLRIHQCVPKLAAHKDHLGRCKNCRLLGPIPDLESLDGFRSWISSEGGCLERDFYGLKKSESYCLSIYFFLS